MLIELSGISKCYPIDKNTHCKVLKNVTLSIEQGEITAIVGKSGAGKSTLLHILGAMDAPTEGSYCLDGVDVGRCNDAQLANLRNQYMGFVLQEFALINDLTVSENILLPAYFSKQPLRKAKAKIPSLLEQMHLTGLEGKKVRHLSGGERQRVAIARALINAPVLLLADEPTGNLDSQTAQSIFFLFKEFCRKGKTVVMVTHDEDLAAQCDRIIRIADGVVSE